MLNRNAKSLCLKIFFFVIALMLFQSLTPRLMAIPAFARKYKTACATCHNNWPELNDFGRAFKINGFRFPKDDDQFVKDPPLLLGAQAQKESFPIPFIPASCPFFPSRSGTKAISITRANSRANWRPRTDTFRLRISFSPIP